MPSILEQTPWAVGFYKWPHRFKTQYFNPGLVDWMGRRWLVARRRRFAVHPGRNDIVMWRLQGDLPYQEFPVRMFPGKHDEHWEDPRAMVLQGQLYISYSNFFTRGYWVHQAIAKVNASFQGDPYHPVFGTNRWGIRANVGHEKNWLWFECEGEPHFIYSTSPHIVVRTKGLTPMFRYDTPGFTWDYGLPRGGAPPVYVPEDKLWWSFFHSSRDIHPTRAPRRRYYMGAYAFEPNPPFRVTHYTREPLMIGSEKDPRELGAPLVVFPCGALNDNGIWHVALGINDCDCAWARIPHEDVKQRVSRV